MFRENRKFWLGFLLFAGTLLLIASGLGRPGITWDEPFYTEAGKTYLDWFKAKSPFSEETLREHWKVEHAHPPLGKLWYGLWATLFSKLTHEASDAQRFYAGVLGARLGASIVSALSVLLIFLLVRRTSSYLVGLLSAATFLFLPRIFVHLHLAALDVPVALGWFLTAFAFFEAMKHPRWAFLCGFFFGLSLLTKGNALFLPLALWPWGLLLYRKRALPAVLSMAIIGPVLFFAFWPWMWLDPLGMLRGFIADKLNRVIIPVRYLGVTYKTSYAPWHYPFLLTALTIPVGIFFALILEVISIFRRRTHSFEFFILWNLLVVLAVAALPNAPKYDGVRLFLPAFPFVAVLAAFGFKRVWDFLLKRFRRKAFAAALLLVFLVSQFFPALFMFPYGLSYYNGFVGGLAGAQRLGFETTYWNEACDGRIYDFLNAKSPLGASVARLLAPLFLRDDIRVVELKERPDFVVLLMREGEFRDFHWRLFRQETPVFGNYAGLQLLSLLPPAPVCLVYDMRGKW